MAFTCAVKKCSNGSYWLNKWKNQLCEKCGCLHKERECRCDPPFRLYTFPTENKNPEKREQWKQLIGRHDGKRLWSPSKDSRVCSDHFIEGEPTCQNPFPTLKLGHEEREAHFKRRSHFKGPDPKRLKETASLKPNTESEISNVVGQGHTEKRDDREIKSFCDKPVVSSVVTLEENEEMRLGPRRHYGCICRNYREKIIDGQSITLHRFPADDKLRNAWIKQIKIHDPNFITDWANAYVCSAHFVGNQIPNVFTINKQREGQEQVGKSAKEAAKAVEIENMTATTCSTPLATLPAPCSRSANTDRLYYSRREPVLYWMHRFCLLAKSTQEIVPNRDYKQVLYEAGLGERTITFLKDAYPESFKSNLENAFPKLKDCSGFELLRTTLDSRLLLEVMKMPAGGFTAAYLANESNLGKAVCYIRPMQKDIPIDEGRKQTVNTGTQIEPEAAEAMEIEYMTATTCSTPLVTFPVPYKQSSYMSANKDRLYNTREEPMLYWKHRFCLLANSTRKMAPTKDYRQVLFEAGLGERKITFLKDAYPESFKSKLEDVFPKLKDCCGFELLRTTLDSRSQLEVMKKPAGGFTAAYLADESSLGQAMCYIRPMQKDIPIDEGNTKEAAEAVEIENVTATTSCTPLRSSYRSANTNRLYYTREGPMLHWTHRFCLLANSTQEMAPNRNCRQVLFEAGLGERKITFLKDAYPESFKSKLEDVFPKLKDCCGFELLRTRLDSKIQLEVMKMPAAGFTTAYLADESNLGQAVCYIRPYQKDIPIDEGRKQTCVGAEDRPAEVYLDIDCVNIKTEDNFELEDDVTNYTEDGVNLNSNDNVTSNAMNVEIIKTENDVIDKSLDVVTLKEGDSATFKTENDVTDDTVDGITIKEEVSSIFNNEYNITDYAMDSANIKAGDDVTIKIENDITDNTVDDVTAKAENDVTDKTENSVNFNSNDDVTFNTINVAIIKTENNINDDSLDGVTIKAGNSATFKTKNDDTDKTAVGITVKTENDVTDSTVDRLTIEARDDTEDDVIFKNVDDFPIGTENEVTVMTENNVTSRTEDGVPFNIVGDSLEYDDITEDIPNLAANVDKEEEYSPGVLGEVNIKNSSTSLVLVEMRDPNTCIYSLMNKNTSTPVLDVMEWKNTGTPMVQDQFEIRKTMSLLFHDYCSKSPHVNNEMKPNQEEKLKHYCHRCTQTSETSSTQTDKIVSNSPKTIIPELRIEDIAQDSSSVMFYTGLSNIETFYALFDELKDIDRNNAGNESKRYDLGMLRKVDELLLVLMRLRLGLLIEDLAYRFHITKTSCAHIFAKWISHLSLKLDILMAWPESRFKSTRKPLFRSNRNNTLSIQLIEFPRSPSFCKALIGITPDSKIKFVSDFYRQTVDERNLTEACGLLDLLHPGDTLVAERWFHSLSDLTAKRGIRLLLPSDKNDTKIQISGGNSLKESKHVKGLQMVTKLIGQRIRHFRILGEMFVSLPMEREIWKICAGLTNLQPPIIL
ncbi:uncharacterized protein LOC123548416 isoform X2 [Mercenaria mercenaria]|uniref:uncharacterized protein LOC123548416 isoform X2 n=1 Tax=Mercenaria mercenaria TaxID=6596 RepID=UPI00234EDF59|nr:uncharacterized protein LOC123548416 isoform X2 [Mercenaria mercenaria]